MLVDCCIHPKWVPLQKLALLRQPRRARLWRQSRGPHHPLNVETFFADSLIVIKQGETRGIDGADQSIGDEAGNFRECQPTERQCVPGMLQANNKKWKPEQDA